MSKKSNKLSFTILYLFLSLFNLLPMRVLYIISDMLYPVLYYIVKYRKRVVYDNLNLCFPDKTEKEITSIAKKFYRHFCDLMLEGIKAKSISEKEIKKRVKFKNLELIEKYQKEGKSVVAILSHYGNWEWTVHMPFFTKLKVLAVAKPQNDLNFNKYINKVRGRFGTEPVAMADTLKVLIKHKRQNNQTILALISDQIPHRGMINYWTKFFGVETGAFLGGEKIAQKFDQPVVFGHMDKVKRGYYEFTFTPLFENPKDEEEYVITETHMKLLEDKIKAKPEYWLWSHRRWKYKKGDKG